LAERSTERISGPIEDSDNEMIQKDLTTKKKKHQFSFPPSIAEVEKAYTDLGAILKPHRKKGYGYKDPGLDRIVTERLSAMKLFCYNFTAMQKAQNSPQWQAASLTTAKSLGGTTYMARNLRE